MKEHETLPQLEAKDPLSRFRMIDVGPKRVTHRQAEAQGRISMGETAFNLISEKQMPKGDVLAMAEMAAIMAAKKTSDWLPLCHPLPIEAIRVRCDLENVTHSILVRCRVSAYAKTGVEMEALCAVQAALLAIYDLTKGVDPVLRLSDIRLNEKIGGKKGHWKHPEFESQSTDSSAPLALQGLRAATLTISDRCSRGIAEDISGIKLREELKRLGCEIAGSDLVADSSEKISDAVLSLIQKHTPSLVMTSGGTGLGPKDITIATLKSLASKEVTGLGELLRQESSKFVKTAWLSNSGAFVIEGALVVALPGSPKAVGECLGILSSLLPHALHILKGGDHAAKAKEKLL